MRTCNLSYGFCVILIGLLPTIKVPTNLVTNVVIWGKFLSGKKKNQIISAYNNDTI